ncbi:hypothetical protein [Planomicrobium sp. CPCC 101110]|uniref:hypothetical protein n=1 Tax=Planomicrobium sp. CPCC 101110 TaxID=2599619 RepID=UPI0016488928|nr:hypothetical protein [Planomicrobium sp. CPCC 101110]
MQGFFCITYSIKRTINKIMLGIKTRIMYNTVVGKIAGLKQLEMKQAVAAKRGGDKNDG